MMVWTMFRFSAASIWVIAFVVCFLPVSGGCGGGPGDSADTMVDAWPDTRVDVPPTDLALDDVEGADSVPDTSCGDICFDDASFGDVSLDATVDVDAGDVVEPPVLCPAFDSRLVAGVLDSTPLNEVSGLAASIRHPGVLWGHNDSGDIARIVAIPVPAPFPGEGMALETVEFTVNRDMVGWPSRGPGRMVPAVDWEDISIGPFAGFGGDAIFIADAGDNAHARKFVRVFVIREPETLVAGDITDVVYFDVVYLDGRHDCEAFFVDRWTGDMYFVAKEQTLRTAGVYRVSASAMAGTPKGTRLRAALIAQVPIGLATGADMSPDGTMLAIRNYGGEEIPAGDRNNGLMFFRTAGMSVRDMLSAPSCPLPNFVRDPVFEIQGESITFSSDGAGIFTAPERFFDLPQNLNFWPIER